MSNAKNNKTAAPKPFCKVCQDAGKPESVYTSHFVRSSSQPGSVVTCPTLLALECRFCHKAGHTVKYCSILEERKKMEKKQQAKEKPKRDFVPVQTQEVKKTYKNKFACLESDDEDEEIKEVVEKIPAPIIVEEKVAVTTYASVLSKPKSEQKTEPKTQMKVLEQTTQTVTTQQVTTKELIKPSENNWAFKFQTKSWADWSDSEDEEDLIKPQLKRQPSIINNEENYDDDDNMPLEPPKLVRQIAQHGGIHTSRLNDDEYCW